MVDVPMRELGTSFVSNGDYMWFRAVNVNRQFVAENGHISK